MTKQAYEEMITALDRRDIGIVHHKYTWRSFGSWEIVVDTTPRRKISWSGHQAKLKIENTIDGDSVAYWNYRLHWEGPEGYPPRTEAVLEGLVADHNPRKEVFLESQRNQKAAFQRKFNEQLEEVPGFGGDTENPALRAYLLGGHINQMSFDERQSVKVGDLIGAVRTYEMRQLRYVVVSGLVAFLWVGLFELNMFLGTLLLIYYFICSLSRWRAARSTRIGLIRLATDAQSALHTQAQPAP